jgi:hypothetical protein
MGQRMQMHRLWYAGALVFITCLMTSAASAADAGEALRNFLATYRCAVVERLERMHARGDRSSQTDLFLILAVRSKPKYVQFIFTDSDTAMYCEATSGFYAPVASRFI